MIKCMFVPIKAIAPRISRDILPSTKVDELAQSIVECGGLIRPLLVQKTEFDRETKAFELAIGIPITTLLHVGAGTTGTWAHPKIAIRFAQWCNVNFAIQVDFWIDELLTTGKVELRKTSFESIANEKDWGKLRSDGKQYRRTYTDRIKEAGGKGLDYAKATNEIYIGATGLDAKQIKQHRGIVKSKPARDALNVGELQIVAMTEWHLSEALPNGSNLGQINQASRSQAERLKSALMVF